MCNHVKHVCMCLLVSSLLFPIHPFRTDNLLTPNNLHSRYQCSTRYSINIIMTILGHHPRASHTPCLLGLIPKGKTNPVSLGTKTQGQDQPRVFRVYKHKMWKRLKIKITNCKPSWGKRIFKKKILNNINPILLSYQSKEKNIKFIMLL